VHVPFCQTICGYCDFYSVPLDRNAVNPLVDSLLADLDTYAELRERPVETIFVGGGTPTTLPPAELRRLLTRLAATLREDLSGVSTGGRAALEFTVEANPATVTPEIAAALVEGGANRVSIGAQSFDTSELRVLDRIHRPEQVGQTVEIARRAGIGEVNLDLIFGVPGQSLDSWLASVRAAIALRPDHLSCYGLTYEKGTPLFERLARGAIQRVDESLEAEMYEATIEELARAGFEQYEISNFARPGRRCRHNLVYWRNEPYVGIGPSAAGFIGGVRYKNIADHAEYARAIREGRSPRISAETLSREHRARETIMLGLRLNDGVDRDAFRGRFGGEPEALFADAFRRLEGLGVLETDPAALRLTPRGRLVADAVAAEFLAE
jgi:oxygen-independent coproporphyrinogen III oxidase